ncbi:hypothetical protein ASE98_08525 [Pseudomonas sp. Leaf48]|jgi:hypothetical protein|uniref:DUF4123 domain-containing protein n=1 Tax=Pseudomonas sp. Leaf48 TaxID=1736221 RepID=UPI000727A5E2|nr:DUF4123 domain-containing protein [Pseudomonas sp. Leaf48]KQN44977.1 hypothetical protein ASE98_08525 [Pseudomonas sp. Leaf48]
MITTQMPTPRPQWLLLDVPGSPGVVTVLQQTFVQARRFWLFEGTEWHALHEHGPVLVDLRTCPALADLCLVDGQRWRGLLIVSQTSELTLLAHLRRMLTVTVGVHRALLSYYNPNTASYFFDACDAVELSRWLGPISQLRWFGGTWADRAIGCEGWQRLLNPALAVTPLAVEESLSAWQREKLQTCLLEQHAWRWSRSSGIDFTRLWPLLQEGLTLGFTERAVLDGWIWLRMQFPAAIPVQPMSGLTQQERLDSLRQLWQNNQP